MAVDTYKGKQVLRVKGVNQDDPAYDPTKRQVRITTVDVVDELADANDLDRNDDNIDMPQEEPPPEPP